MPILAAWQFILLLAAAILATPLYRNGHIPGAVSIGDAGNVLRNPVTEDFIETALVENILGNAGIDPARAIIIYADYGNPYVYFGRLALRYFGAQQVRVFHDGIQGWQEAGNAVETTNALETLGFNKVRV